MAPGRPARMSRGTILPAIAVAILFSFLGVQTWTFRRGALYAQQAATRASSAALHASPRPATPLRMAEDRAPLRLPDPSGAAESADHLRPRGALDQPLTGRSNAAGAALLRPAPEPREQPHELPAGAAGAEAVRLPAAGTAPPRAQYTWQLRKHMGGQWPLECYEQQAARGWAPPPRPRSASAGALPTLVFVAGAEASGQRAVERVLERALAAPSSNITYVNEEFFPSALFSGGVGTHLDLGAFRRALVNAVPAFRARGEGGARRTVVVDAQSTFPYGGQALAVPELAHLADLDGDLFDLRLLVLYRPPADTVIAMLNAPPSALPAGPPPPAAQPSRARLQSLAHQVVHALTHLNAQLVSSVPCDKFVLVPYDLFLKDPTAFGPPLEELLAVPVQDDILVEVANLTRQEDAEAARVRRSAGGAGAAARARSVLEALTECRAGALVGEACEQRVRTLLAEFFYSRVSRWAALSGVKPGEESFELLQARLGSRKTTA